MITEEQKQAWVAALRSGQYKQGRGYDARLEDDRTGWRYCALGVLGEVLGLEKQRFGRYMQYRGLSSGHYYIVPCALQALAVRWNDFQKLSFVEIADRLERTSLEELRGING